jgi:hypothetical protein
MRLWSLHPSILDARGLVAVWREGLLARAVLRGRTRGYRRHPQLDRFRAHPSPVSAINHYLIGILREALQRGYAFDRAKIGPIRDPTRMSVTSGQLALELEHLRAKVAARARHELGRLPKKGDVRAHPLFDVVEGPVEAWERGLQRLSTGASLSG